MFVVLWLGISLVTGMLAARKGYNFLLWALAGGVIGLVLLAFLPFANKPGQPPEEQARLKKTGNIMGGVLAAFSVLVIVTRLLPS